MEALGHRIRAPDFLVDFHACARAHDPHIIADCLDDLPGRLLGVFRHGEDAVALANVHRHGRADRLGEPAGKAREVKIRRHRPHRKLHVAAVACPIDREAGAVRPAVAHGGEHARHHSAELGLERLVLEEKTDNSAHSSTAALSSPPLLQSNGSAEPLSTVRNNNFL